ncbi:dethiobiotin synthetase, partial [Streptomyces griseoflavus Tu4000]
ARGRGAGRPSWPTEDTTWCCGGTRAGLLVRFDAAGGDAGGRGGKNRSAPVLVVASAGLGTLNVTELTSRELRGRGLGLLGVVIGSWPAEPDLASRCNLLDLSDVTGAPLLGAVPAGAGALGPAGFRTSAPHWLAPRLEGTWDAETFRVREAP